MLQDYSALKQSLEATPGWLIYKPGSACEGKGIFLTNTLDDIAPDTTNVIVQRYLDNVCNPSLLIDGRTHVLLF